jgi:hypothetical protein
MRKEQHLQLWNAWDQVQPFHWILCREDSCFFKLFCQSVQGGR